jgi:predicted dehydrogenase
MKRRKIRFGIFGAGNIARLFCETIKNIDNAEIVAISSLFYDQAQSLAAEYGVRKAYAEDGLLARDPEVDAVFVGTVNTLHYDNCLLALQNN